MSRIVGAFQDFGREQPVGSELPSPRKPLLLAGSLVLAGIIALSVHVAMLAAGAPFPVPNPPIWARWLHDSVIIGAMLAFLKLAAPRIGHRSFRIRTFITFMIMATIQETLRVAIMTGVVTGGWAFAVIELAKPLIRVLVLTLLCVVSVRWARSGPVLVAVALVAGALAIAVQKLVGLALAPVIELAPLARGDLYVFPYPFHVTLLAYLTFVEAVVGATLMIMLVWDQLPNSRPVRLLLVGLLVALLKGVVGKTFLYSPFTAGPVWLGMVAYSQFLFEFLALGVLAGLAWEAFGKRSDAYPTSPTDRREP